MAEIVPPTAPAPISVLGYDGTNFYQLRVDATGHLQVDVLTSALPAGAATAANQVTQITALQLIDDLRNALQSVGTDRLQARGEDQLFSFKGVLAVNASGAISGAGGYIASPAVPAGEIWVVTTILAMNLTTACSAIEFQVLHDAILYNVKRETRAFPAWDGAHWSGHTYLDEADVVRAYFTGALAGDTVCIHLTGYRMTVEV